MGQVAVYSGVERRRRWTDAERLEILSEAFAPGATIAQVARRRDVSTGQIYTWRRKLLVQSPGGPEASALIFSEAVVIDGPISTPSSVAPVIVIDLDRGKRISIFASAPAALTTAALRALR